MIRGATPDDAPAVGELIRELAEYERLAHEVVWDDEGLAAALFGPGAVPRVLLAEPDDEPGTVAGVAIWFPTFSTFLGRPGIWLEDLFVRPRHRGRGLGAALLAALLARADGGRVEWAVLDWNTTAAEFYGSFGAEPVPGWTRYRWVAGGADPGAGPAPIG